MFDNETNVLQVLRSSPGHTFASTLYVSAACMAEDAATPAQLLDAVTAWAHGALRDDSGDESGDDDSAPPTFTANATCAECTTVRPVGSPRVTVCLTARVPLGQEPPCALVVVDRLPRGAAVELEVVAAAHNRAATMLTKRWSPAEGVCCWPQCACMCPPLPCCFAAPRVSTRCGCHTHGASVRSGHVDPALHGLLACHGTRSGQPCPGHRGSTGARACVFPSCCHGRR